MKRRARVITDTPFGVVVVFDRGAEPVPPPPPAFVAVRENYKPHPEWRRVDGGKGKLSAIYEGPRGWVAMHCGHPTANHPIALYNRHGVMVCAGAVHTAILDETPRHRARCGYAWANLMRVFAFVDWPGSRPFEQLKPAAGDRLRTGR